MSKLRVARPRSAPVATAQAAAKAAKMRVAAIPDRRFVDPREYEKKADYVLGSVKELPQLVRKEL